MNVLAFFSFLGKNILKVRKSNLKAPNKISQKSGVLLWKKKEHIKTEAEYKTSRRGVKRALLYASRTERADSGAHDPSRVTPLMVKKCNLLLEGLL